MNALILNNDEGEQRTPRISACKPSCAIFPPWTGQEAPGDVPHRNTAVYEGARRSRRKHRRFCFAGAVTTARSAGGFGDGGLTLLGRPASLIDADFLKSRGKSRCFKVSHDAIMK